MDIGNIDRKTGGRGETENRRGSSVRYAKGWFEVRLYTRKLSPPILASKMFKKESLLMRLLVNGKSAGPPTKRESAQVGPDEIVLVVLAVEFWQLKDEVCGLRHKYVVSSDYNEINYKYSDRDDRIPIDEVPVADLL